MEQSFYACHFDNIDLQGKIATLAQLRWWSNEPCLIVSRFLDFFRPNSFFNILKKNKSAAFKTAVFLSAKHQLLSPFHLRKADQQAENQSNNNSYRSKHAWPLGAAC